jgi:hypothetical protein
MRDVNLFLGKEPGENESLILQKSKTWYYRGCKSPGKETNLP